MSKYSFKHNVGDLVELSTGQFGKVINGCVVYEIAIDAENTIQAEEDGIVTHGKTIRTRKKKEFIPPNVQNH